MKKRSIGLAVIFTIITFGIYGIYWYSQINAEAIKRNSSEWNQSYVIVFILSIITCNIYSMYWSYKLGKAFAPSTGDDKSTLFVILSLFGFTIVNICILQNEVNKSEDNFTIA